MSTFTQLKANVRANLGDDAVTFYAASEMDNSFQDAYDDIVFHSQCIVKKTTLSWQANIGHLDLKNDFGVSDYLATTAIFDNVTNRWLRDDLTYRDFRTFRPDWQLVTASPQFWAPKDPIRITIFPKYATAAGTFDLYYWATAPTVVDGDTPLIPTDMQTLLEQYSTPDLLETAEEFKKALHYWKQYYDLLQGVDALRSRLKNLAKSDLLLLG